MNASLGVDHGNQGGFGREHCPRAQPWIGRLQKNNEKSSNMSTSEIKSVLALSGWLNASLGVDHGNQFSSDH